MTRAAIEGFLEKVGTQLGIQHDVPAVEWVQRGGMPVEGPFPPDALFLPVRRKRFNAVVCMYHDQGHVPLKLLDFEGA